jgi:hypothetical protein
MRVRVWLVVRGLLAVGMILSVAGCMGAWFDPPQVATFFLGKPVISEGQGEVTISVTNMPDGGLAAIHVHFGGMTYNEEKISDLAVVGLNGFGNGASDQPVASEFTDGEGGFILINLLGVENGAILKLTFKASGNVTIGDIVLIKDQIDLTNDAITLIDSWNLPAYYAK